MTERKDKHPPKPTPERRTILKGAAALVSAGPALWLASASTAGAATDDPKSQRPQIGDRFVYMKGKRKNEIALKKDLEPGKRQQLVYPIDPATGIVRNGSPLNIVMLIRLDPEDMDEETRAMAVDDLLAYSGACTHHGCTVSQWHKRNRTLYCPCHTSEFEPTKAGKVRRGPAPRRLPMLSIDVDEDGAVVVAGEFTARLGRIKK